MDRNFLLDILGNLRNDSTAVSAENRRESNEVFSQDEHDDENDSSNSNDSLYNKMVQHLYKQTLILDQTLINKEEHNDLIETYNDLIASKTHTRPHTTNYRTTSNVSPISSVHYEYTSGDGRSSVSISSNTSPLLLGMMPQILSGFGMNSTGDLSRSTIGNSLQNMQFMMEETPQRNSQRQRTGLNDIISLTPMMSNLNYSSTPNFHNQFEFGLMDPFDLLPGMDNVLQSFLRAFTDTGERPDPLNNDVFNTFKEVPFEELKNHTNIEVTNNCSICLSGFDNEKEEDRKVLITPCGHYFHKQCIKEWLTKCHYKCPLCKRSCDPSRKESGDKIYENTTTNQQNDKTDDSSGID